MRNIKKNTIMNLKKANCRNCYKCIRACPVKAISIVGDKIKIIETQCMFCGRCYMVCPQDARDLVSDLSKVKRFIAEGKPVYASVAPAFPAYFQNANIWNFAPALKKLGFSHVEETAIGAARVSEQYLHILNAGIMKNLITSACPSTNMLVQKFFPELVKYLAPVDTPVEAHAKMMKAAYGNDIKFVSITPCIAEKAVAEESLRGTLIDAVITFEEIDIWLREENVVIGDEDLDVCGVSEYRARYYPETGGILRSLPLDIKRKYKIWTEDGGGRAKELLKNFANENLEGYFLEISGCNGACLGSPIMKMMDKLQFAGKNNWLLTVKMNKNPFEKNLSEEQDVDIQKFYDMKSFPKPMPNEDQLKQILAIVGKTKKEHELDCSGCGYPTCREKAIAVYQGKADPHMCIPYSRDLAESQSNLLFEHIPSGMIIMGENLIVREINPAAEKIFNKKNSEVVGTSVLGLLDPDFLKTSSIRK